VNGHRGSAIFLLCILFIVSFSTISIIDSSSENGWAGEELQTIIAIESPINYTEDWSQACSSVIVTGNATKDGRAILMKNRDWPYDRGNVPIYVPSTEDTYAALSDLVPSSIGRSRTNRGESYSKPENLGAIRVCKRRGSGFE